MPGKLVFNKSIVLNAPVSRVWQALVDPEQIKVYMFGTHTESDWKKGSTITYSGEWNGKAYKDSGTIVDIIPEQKLHTTYFSSMSGKEDKPENYANVIYEVEPEDGKTKFTITQDNIADEAQLEHMAQNWGMVMDSLKKLVEQ